MEYYEACSKPDALPKNVLLRTLEALKKAGAEEAKIVEEIITSEPIPVPDKYTGTEQQFFYKVHCKELEAEAIADVLFDLEASSVPPSGIGTSETSQYVELVNIWSELTEYVGKNV